MKSGSNKLGGRAQSLMHGRGFKYKVIDSEEPVSEYLRTSADGALAKNIVFLSFFIFRIPS